MNNKNNLIYNTNSYNNLSMMNYQGTNKYTGVVNSVTNNEGSALYQKQLEPPNLYTNDIVKDYIKEQQKLNNIQNQNTSIEKNDINNTLNNENNIRKEDNHMEEQQQQNINQQNNNNENIVKEKDKEEKIYF